MNPSSEFANQKLRTAGRAKDKARRLAWCFLISAIALEVLLAVAMIDYWLALPAPLRMGGFVLLLLLLAAGLGGWMRLRRRPTSMKEAALDAEAQRPDMGCVISTAAEYSSGERPIRHEYEPELVAALEAQAAKNLQEVQVSYANRFSRPAWFLAFALLSVLIFAALAPVAFTAFKRTVSPWSRETYTQVAVRRGNVEIPVGSDLDITNVFSGRIPKNPELHWLQEGQSTWQSVPLKRFDDGSYVHSFGKLETSMKYRVTGGDAVSETYDITAFVPPEVRELRVDVAYPAYTRVQPFFQQAPELTVLRASELAFHISPSTNLSKARLRFSSLPGIDLTPAENGQWAVHFKAATNADYWIELADAKGHGGGNEQPYHLTVLPDNPPKIEITEPGQDIRAEATNTIPLKFAASDDFGVREIKLLYHRLGGPEQTLNCVFTNTENTGVAGGVELALANLGLKDHELVAYHAEAKDNNTLDGPGVGVSPVYFIEITSDEGGHQTAEPKSDGETLNLLVIQKQIIADTTALPPKPAPEKFDGLAYRQQEAAELAETYRDSLRTLAAPGEAGQLIEDAIKEMKSAGGSLAGRKREAALPSEEKALADLYQIMKLLPQLGNLPTEPPTALEQARQSPMLNVVLESIKKQKKEPPSNVELAQALEEAKQLSRSQAEMLPGLDPTGQQAENGSQGSEGAKTGGEAGEKNEGQKADAQAKTPENKQGESGEAGANQGDKGAQADDKQGEGKDGQGKAGTKQGEGKKGQQANKPGAKPGEGKAGQGANPEAKPGDQKEDLNMEKMAELESELSKEAAALAEKLEKLANKDMRLGHNAARKAAQAAGQMGAAAQSLRQGNVGAAGTEGGQSLSNLDKVIAALERLLKGQPNLADVAAEDFPKGYESLISEYLRKLSHAE